MSHKKKLILLCSLPGDYSGVPKYVAFISKELKEQYRFVILSGGNGGIYDDAPCEVQIDSGFKNSLSLLKILNNLKRLDKIIEKNNFDIVHLNGAMFGLLGRILSLKYKNIRFIFTIHGITWGEGRSFFMSFLMKTIEKLLYRNASNTILISRKDYDTYKKITDKKISYIPNSVTFDGANFNYKYEEASIEKNLICVARFSKQKNFSRLFSAFNKLNVPCKLFLIGEDTDSNECIKLAKSLMDHQSFQSIEFIGKTNNVKKYLKKATLFILSSDYEGMPLSALEASYFNIPVIMPAWVEHMK